MLLVTIEDVTEKVRARMHIDAIHYISSAIARGAALPHVLDRVLQAVQELVGSTRCAILLLETPSAASERSSPPRVSIAAQKGLHLSSQGWKPQLGEHMLLGTRHPDATFADYPEYAHAPGDRISPARR